MGTHGFNDASTEARAILVPIEEKSSPHKFSGVNNGNGSGAVLIFLNIVLIVVRLIRFDNRWDSLPFKGIRAQIRSIRVYKADIGAAKNFVGVISKNFKGHYMPHVISNAN